MQLPLPLLWEGLLQRLLATMRQRTLLWMLLPMIALLSPPFLLGVLV